MDLKSIREDNVIERYVTGRLPPEEEARFEEFLLLHPECAAQVEDAERLHRGLEAVAADAVTRTAFHTGLWAWLSRHRTLAALGVALVFLVPLGVQLVRIGELEEELATALEPRINTPIVELAPFRSSPFGAEPQRLTLPDELEWLVITLDVAGHEDAGYRLTLRGTEGALLWQGSGLRPDPLGRLVVTLPSTLLAPGDYELVAEALGEAPLAIPPLSSAGRARDLVTLVPLDDDFGKNGVLSRRRLPTRRRRDLPRSLPRSR